jgi:beta-phosphoglucomutase-like phosphatase (HAD superfamily)
VIDSANALEAAWSAFLDEQGISLEDMAKAGPPRHPVVKSILGRTRDEPEKEAVESIVEMMRGYLAA